MEFSKRIQMMDHSPIRRLYPLAAYSRARGINVIQGNIGQPDAATPDLWWRSIERQCRDALEADGKAAADLRSASVLAYGPSDGLPGFKRALEGYYQRLGLDVDESHLLVTTAASEAILFVLIALCDPGDAILVPEPLYANYQTFCAMASVRLIPIPCKWEDGFALPPPDQIEPLIDARTRAVFLCNPNNPSGYVMEMEELAQLVSLCRRHGLHVVSDEVYREFVYDGEPVSLLSVPGSRGIAIVVDSCSKRYSACGARLGVVICHDPIFMSHMTKLAQARLCPPTLEQIGAASVVQGGDAHITRMKHLYAERIGALCNALRSIPNVEYLRPKGAFYVMVRLPVADAADFASYLLEQVSVDGSTLMVAPGSGFYATPGRGLNEIRLAAVLETEILVQATNILGTGLEQYLNRRDV